MSVLVKITGPALAFDAAEKPVTDAKSLRSINGVVHDGEICSDYFQFGEMLDDAGIEGGAIGLSYNRGKQRLEVVCTYRAPRRLKPEERKALLAETSAQLSDGIGEGCFDPVPGQPQIFVDVFPASAGAPLRFEQTGKADASRKRKPNLWAAATKGDVARILAALEAGADINELAKGYSALNLAVAEGHADAVKTLLEHGADIATADPTGMQPIHTCIASSGIKTPKNRLQLLQLLLDAGADVNAIMPSAGTPLAMAISYRRGKAIAEALTAKGGTE